MSQNSRRARGERFQDKSCPLPAFGLFLSYRNPQNQLIAHLVVDLIGDLCFFVKSLIVRFDQRRSILGSNLKSSLRQCGVDSFFSRLGDFQPFAVTTSQVHFKSAFNKFQFVGCSLQVCLLPGL